MQPIGAIVTFLSVLAEGTMRVWLACFLVLFAIAEFFDWVQQFELPLPIYILGGAFLAVASNYNKLLGSYFRDADAEIPSMPTINSSSQSEFTSAPPPPKPISFTIRRSIDSSQSEIK